MVNTVEIDAGRILLRHPTTGRVVFDTNAPHPVIRGSTSFANIDLVFPPAPVESQSDSYWGFGGHKTSFDIVLAPWNPEYDFIRARFAGHIVSTQPRFSLIHYFPWQHPMMFGGSALIAQYIAPGLYLYQTVGGTVLSRIMTLMQYQGNLILRVEQSGRDFATQITSTVTQYSTAATYRITSLQIEYGTYIGGVL